MTTQPGEGRGLRYAELTDMLSIFNGPNDNATIVHGALQYAASKLVNDPAQLARGEDEMSQGIRWRAKLIEPDNAPYDAAAVERMRAAAARRRMRRAAKEKPL